jgi:hypothetical protein
MDNVLLVPSYSERVFEEIQVSFMLVVTLMMTLMHHLGNGV